MELRYRAQDDGGGWMCYRCETGKDRVLLFGAASGRAAPAHLEYLCDDCLVNVIVTGEVVLHTPDKDAPVKTDTETPTIVVREPVTIDDDGNTSVSGFEIRW